MTSALNQITRDIQVRISRKSRKANKKHIKSLEKDLAKAKKRSIKWYKEGLRQGLRQGYIEACDSLIDPDGGLSLQGEDLLSHSKRIKIHVPMKTDRESRMKTFDFTAKELGFEDA